MADVSFSRGCFYYLQARDVHWLIRQQFAIRPNVRNHKTMTRDTIIRTVAAAVGQGHSVDLKNYDLLILVDIYKASSFDVMLVGGSDRV